MCNGTGRGFGILFVSAILRVAAHHDAVLSQAERQFFMSAAREALVSMADAIVPEDPGQTRAHEAASLALAVPATAARLIRGAHVRDRILQLGRLRLRLNEVLDELNALVPRPRLMDRPRNMWKGLETWLSHAQRPIHPLALLPLVNILSVQRVVHIVPTTKRVRGFSFSSRKRRRLRMAEAKRRASEAGLGPVPKRARTL
jgi:hypothetical protein